MCHIIFLIKTVILSQLEPPTGNAYLYRDERETGWEGYEDVYISKKEDMDGFLVCVQPVWHSFESSIQLHTTSWLPKQKGCTQTPTGMVPGLGCPPEYYLEKKELA